MAQAIRERCWPLRERSWALKGLSAYQLADAARLRAKSDDLVARSRRSPFTWPRAFSQRNDQPGSGAP
ncbi:MAG TPA: hypothetical protein VF252_11675 [Gemmatimonadales bacterium]